MRHLAILKLLLTVFLMYMAHTYIDVSSTAATMFWGLWFGFCWLVIGANLATVLAITRAPIMEQTELKQRKTSLY